MSAIIGDVVRHYHTREPLYICDKWRLIKPQAIRWIDERYGFDARAIMCNMTCMSDEQDVFAIAHIEYEVA